MAHIEQIRSLQPTPLEVDRRLRTRLAEAVVSRAGIKDEGLNAFLRTRLSASGGTDGALLSEPVFEAAASYVSSGARPEELQELLHPRTIDALANTPDQEFRFDYPVYRHQLLAWQLLAEQERNSVLVSSGTGSGKTECFLVPMLDDLAREVEETGALTGVRALMIYPLNALIASQEKRLGAWTKPFGGDIRFALYNGLMRDAREAKRGRDEREVPEQVLYRKTLRADPPPILVTNQTMLEYMTIRREDRPILDASCGKLRWIVVDEAHSYVGSAAAELSLLLRRAMHAFAVDPNEVRFVATSATIGSHEPESIEALRRFLADLAGIELERAHVVVGERQPTALGDPAPATAPPDPSAPKEVLACHPQVQRLVRTLEKAPRSARSLCDDATPEAQVEDLLTAVAGRTTGIGGPLLPIRVHKFLRAVPGLWSCIDAKCNGDKPDGWPFGAVLFEKRDACPHCHALAFEILSCCDCGEPYLQAWEEDGLRIVPEPSAGGEDEFRADSYREHDGEVEDSDPAPPDERRRFSRLIARHAPEGRAGTDLDVRTGAVSGRHGRYHLTQLDEGRCPECRSPRRKGRPPLMPFRFGAPFLMQNAVPVMLEGVAAHHRTDAELPFNGRQLLSFTDSRQGTARFAANVETNGERGFVRGFLYHAVQKAARGTALSPDRREQLEKKKALLESMLTQMPAFKDDIARINRELGGGETGESVAWQDLVRSLAGEPAVRNWMARVWDEDRTERYHRDPEALARFLLLRELARRPRTANAVETLGLARLVIPAIERLSESQVPEQFSVAGLGPADWRDFLYYLVDVLRTNFVVDIERDDARWMPGRAFPKQVVGPGQARRNKSDYRWPSVNAKGRQPDAVLLLGSALRLSPAESRGAHEINEVLAQAWTCLCPLLETTGAYCALSLEKSVKLGAVGTAWICPLTRRLLPRLVLGRSPNMIGAPGGLAAKQPEEVHLPKLPLTFPPGEPERRQIVAFLEADERIGVLRARGVWADLQDRAAHFAPYIRAEEHSAQQPPHRLRRFEEEFKDGEINLLACSTTMEMGVDIGSIETIVNTNVPPSIANYNQRAGRAGRRGQGFSSTLTIARDTPLDRETFRAPVAYLARKLYAPRVSLDSARIAQRHANAFLLAAWFRHADGDFVRMKAGEFFGCRADFRPFEDETPFDRFCRWVRQPGTAQQTDAGLSRLLKGTELEFDDSVRETAAQMFAVEARRFLDVWERMRDDAGRLTDAAQKFVRIEATRLCREPLLKELANRSLLPGSGFPTAVVPFVTLCRETKTLRRGDDAAEDTPRDRRYEYPSRNADIAIREYAPGAEVVVDGLVWTSAGVTLNWLRPADAGGKEPQSLRWSWACHDCGETGCCRTRPESCDNCGSTHIERERFLEPAGFRVDYNAKPHADTDNAVFIESRVPRVSAATGRWQPLLTPESGRIRATADGLVYHYTRGTADEGYDICLECGRAGESGQGFLDEHNVLTPRSGGNVGRCPGNDSTYANTGAIALGHEVHTDVAEIQIVGLEGDGCAWALAAALREALSRKLGIVPRELGIAVRNRGGQAGGLMPSIFLFDQSSGGAGYTPRILDDLPALFCEAATILDCPRSCDRACSACVLLPDLYRQQEKLDRKKALVLARQVHSEMADPGELDRAVPGARLSPAVADAIALRMRPKDRVDIFMSRAFDLTALFEAPLKPLFALAEARRVGVTLALTKDLFDDLEEVERRSLRDAATRHGFTLARAERRAGANGALLIAQHWSKDGVTGYFSRQENAAVPGQGWGRGDAHPVVCGALEGAVKPDAIDTEELERAPQPGDRVVLMEGFPQGPANSFGARLVKTRLQPELETAGLWRPGKLRSLSYEDRYLHAPLPALLLLRTCAALRKSLCDDTSTNIPLEILTSPLRSDRRSPRKIFHDWYDEDARADTVQALGEKLGIDVAFRTGDAPHGRRLTLWFEDDAPAVILFDQGFGYWQTAGSSDHDFRAHPNAQAAQLERNAAPVAGRGGSYFAITRSR